MIIIGIDGLNWESALEYFNDVFPNQNMKMIYNNVRRYTNTPDKPQPTLTGLLCMLSGEKIRDFDENLLQRFNPIYNENKPFNFIKKDGTPMELLFEAFEKPKIQYSHQGVNPYCNEEYFKYWTSLRPHVKICPSEEWCIFPELFKKDYDLFHIHSEIGKVGVLQHGPYEQGRIPAMIPFEKIRKDKPFTKEVYLFGLKRWKYIIKEYISKMLPEETIVITSDHGTSLELPLNPKHIDEIPLIVNRDIDMSDIKFQWDFKKFIFRLKERE